MYETVLNGQYVSPKEQNGK